MTFTINYYINHDIQHGFPRVSFNSPPKKKEKPLRSASLHLRRQAQRLFPRRRRGQGCQGAIRQPHRGTGGTGATAGTAQGREAPRPPGKCWKCGNFGGVWCGFYMILWRKTVIFKDSVDSGNHVDVKK